MHPWSGTNIYIHVSRRVDRGSTNNLNVVVLMVTAEDVTHTYVYNDGLDESCA